MRAQRAVTSVTLEGMKARVTRFKSLEVGLKELEQFVRDGAHLQTGKPFKRFGGLRSREVLANWLLCVVANSSYDTERFTFTTDPSGGDGLLHDTLTGKSLPTEHILVPAVPRLKPSSIEAEILRAIGKKQNKGGPAYASGKTLVVFLNSGGGEWFPNKVARQLPVPLHFDAAWVVGLQGVEETGQYVYAVSLLSLSPGNAPSWLVSIAPDFNSWQVETVQ